MHLLIATPHYPPESGGPATYAKILADELPAMGVTVDVVRFAKVRRYPKILRPLLYLGFILRSAKHADVILSLDPVSTGLPSAVAAALLNKPLVAKIVGDIAWERSHQFYGMNLSPDDFVKVKQLPVAIALYRKVQEWVAKRAKCIIVPSHHLKNIITAWGIAGSKVEVVYNSVEPARAGMLPEILRPRRGLRVVTVARLIRLKNVDALITAVERIPGTELIIVGDGPERQTLVKRANDNPAIHFTGAVPYEDATAIIRSADALVLNSFHEGLSHVLIEGLIAGVPIVATDTGGNPEVLAQGSGLLIPVGDTDALISRLQRLKDEPELRNGLRRAAMARADAFSTETMLRRTKRILDVVQSHA